VPAALAEALTKWFGEPSGSVVEELRGREGGTEGT